MECFINVDITNGCDWELGVVVGCGELRGC